MANKKKKKEKKLNPKKEKYAKFRKDKPAAMDLSMPDLSEDQQKQKQDDEKRINMFGRYSKNPPTKEIVERKMRSKR